MAILRTIIYGSDFNFFLDNGTKFMDLISCTKFPCIPDLSWMQAADHAIKQWRSFLTSVEKTHGHGPDE